MIRDEGYSYYSLELVQELQKLKQDFGAKLTYSGHSLLFSDGRTDVQLSSVKHQVVGLFPDNFLCIFHGFKCHNAPLKLQLCPR